MTTETFIKGKYHVCDHEDPEKYLNKNTYYLDGQNR